MTYDLFTKISGSKSLRFTITAKRRATKLELRQKGERTSNRNQPMNLQEIRQISVINISCNIDISKYCFANVKKKAIIMYFNCTHFGIESVKQTPFSVINLSVNCLLNTRDCRVVLFIKIYFIHMTTGQFLFWINQSNVQVKKSNKCILNFGF